MPWHIENDNPECDGYAVVKDDDGAIEGCHTTEEAALEQLAALYASEEETEPEEDGEELQEAEPVAVGIEAHAHPRAARPDRETRSGTIELRESADGSTVTVVGYASTTEDPYPVTDWLGEYEETISRTAFDKTLQEADVRFYVNHEGIALARSSAGNLRLEADDIGLRYEAELPARVSVVSDLAELMRAGIMRESSFAFRTVKDKWNSDYSKRRVEEVQLIDVSVVSLPANPNATAGIRAALAVRSLAPELWTPDLGRELVAAVREGKVLSESNAAKLREAIGMLEAVLAAAEKSSEAKSGARDARAMMVSQALVEVARRRR